MVVNANTRVFMVQLFADNPAAGIYCGTYEGTGASGNKITTGFAVGTFICGDGDTNRNWTILDKKLGLSSQIQLDSNAQAIVGGCDSFDSDGITLGSGLDTNASGDTFWFIAIADPDLI